MNVLKWVARAYLEEGWRGLSSFGFCRCCHKIGRIHGWMRWGHRIPLPVCTMCKYHGCDRCWTGRTT